MINKNSTHQDIVLIVEDTPANHDVIRTFLDDMGILCESAFDGLEAVTKCTAADCNHYSLILMDLNLPHMDGYQTSKALRKLGVTTPIISITATDKSDPRLSQARRIFNGVLFKPFNVSDFFSAISPYMQSSAFCQLNGSSTSRSTFPHACKCNAPNSQIASAPCNESVSPESLPCSISSGIENLGSNRKLFVKHFNNFKANNADLTLRLSDLLRQGRCKDAAFLCHSIKGLSGMLGMHSLQIHLAELENMLKNESENRRTVSSHILKQLAVITSDLRYICQIHID